MVFSTRVMFIILALTISAACKKDQDVQTAPGATAPPGSASSQQGSPGKSDGGSSGPAKIDACALLTSNEIEAVQNEAVKETKLSGNREGGFNVSRCFFMLPTFTNSVSLQITQRGDGPDGRDPKSFWGETFHREHIKKREPGREKTAKKEEEGESAPPVKVTGVGDESFWMGTRVGGALYVLKGNSYLRVSIGGSGEEADKIKRSKELAQKVAARL